MVDGSADGSNGYRVQSTALLNSRLPKAVGLGVTFGAVADVLVDVRTGAVMYREA